MGSTSDIHLLSTSRLDQLSLAEGPIPSRTTMIDHRPSRERWDLAGSSIWHNAQLPEYITNDDRRRAFPSRDHKTTTTDMSKIVARASAVRDHNMMNTSAGNLLPIGSDASTLHIRSTNSLISPTKMRGNGILGAETSTTLTDAARSHLLSGSSPDMDPPNQPSSSQLTLTNHSGSTVGRSFRRFNVEDAEEFVPSYLDRRSEYPNRTTRFDRDDHPYPYDRPNDMTGFGADFLHSQALPLQRTKDTPQVPLNEARVTANHLPAYPPQYRWPTQSESNMSVDSDVHRHHKPSGLRADVPSYRPSNHNTSNLPNNNQQNGAGHGYHVEFTKVSEVDYSASNSMNQQAVFANSNAYNRLSMTRPDTFHSYHNDSRQPHIIPQLNTSRFESNRSVGSQYRNYALHSVNRNGMPYEVDVRATYDSGIQQAYPIANANAYAVQHYDYVTGSSQPASYYSQARSQEPASGTVNNITQATYSHEEEQKVEGRSPKLEEFRINQKNWKYELRDIYGHIVEFSGDQGGSRFIQTKLETANSDEKDRVFAELQDNAKQLMSDVFGNYVIQKMFEYGNQSQKKALAGHMQGYVLKLSLQPYGCRCVQKAFEHILVEQQALLIKELEGHVIAVVESQHGNHVIQKAIECLQAADVQFIVDAHKHQVVRLARHTYGCRIVQRMLEYCAPHAKRAILDELQPAIPLLIEDQFGNYVIQCIIKQCGAADRYKVIEHVQQRVLRYSTHKFASNVVEVAIQYAEEGQKATMVRMLTGPDPHMGMQTPVNSLLKDQYGNYVMQTVLRTIQGPAKRVLAEDMRCFVECAAKVNRGRQVTAMQETLNAITASHSPSSISSGPQTPRTPTSLQSGGSVGTPVSKTTEIDAAGYVIRDSHHQSGITFGHF